MAMTFGDITDATNTARRDTAVVVVDQNGIQYAVQACSVLVDSQGAVTEVKLTGTPG